jgi:hypothetical protein
LPWDARPTKEVNPEVRASIEAAIRGNPTMKGLKYLVDKGVNVTLTLAMYTRGVDGPGSSQVRGVLLVWGGGPRELRWRWFGRTCRSGRRK